MGEGGGKPSLSPIILQLQEKATAMKGIIKSFVPEKKYGFIKGDDGKDYFFHLADFQAQLQKDKITDGAPVEFEPTANSKGYRAVNCSLVDLSDVSTYVVPDDFPTSKFDTLPGWEIIEMGDWIVHGSSSESPNAAKMDLIDSALRVRANALVNVEYYKTTGSAGNYRYSIHNYRARIVKVARKSSQGEHRLEDLRDLNQKAAAEKQRLVELTNQSKKAIKKKKNIIWGILGSFTVAIFLATGVTQFGIFAGVMALIFGLGEWGQATDYDFWLQQVPYE